MRQFCLFEFVCGGGCLRFPGFGTPGGSLLKEGRQMLLAASSDLLAIPDSRLLVPIDARVPVDDFCRELFFGLNEDLSRRIEVQQVEGDGHLMRLLRKGLGQSDYSVLIAPEIENALASFTRIFEKGDAVFLGAGSELVDLCSDKWATFQHLSQHQIPTVPTVKLADFSESNFGDDCVVKPRFGAGSWGVRRLDFGGIGLSVAKETNPDASLIQPFWMGQPASIAVFAEALTGKRRYLPAVDQQFASGTFEYSGCEGPLPTDLNKRARILLDDVLDSLPPFSGYLGIDLILGSSAEGKNDVVVEINPRLTTSYPVTRKLVPWNGYESLVQSVERAGLRF